MPTEQEIHKEIQKALRDTLAFERYKARMAVREGTYTQEYENLIMKVTRLYYQQLDSYASHGPVDKSNGRE